MAVSPGEGAELGWARGLVRGGRRRRLGLREMLGGGSWATRVEGWAGFWSGQPIRRTVPPQGMALGPMGRALHSVNAVGGGSEKRELGGSRAKLVSALGRGKEREKFLRRTAGMCGWNLLYPRLRRLRERWALLEALLSLRTARHPGTLRHPSLHPWDSSALRRTLFKKARSFSSLFSPSISLFAFSQLPKP